MTRPFLVHMLALLLQTRIISIGRLTKLAGSLMIMFVIVINIGDPIPIQRKNAWKNVKSMKNVKKLLGLFKTMVNQFVSCFLSAQLNANGMVVNMSDLMEVNLLSVKHLCANITTIAFSQQTETYQRIVCILKNQLRKSKHSRKCLHPKSLAMLHGIIRDTAIITNIVVLFAQNNLVNVTIQRCPKIPRNQSVFNITKKVGPVAYGIASTWITTIVMKMDVRASKLGAQIILITKKLTLMVLLMWMLILREAFRQALQAGTVLVVLFTRLMKATSLL